MFFKPLKLKGVNKNPNFTPRKHSPVHRLLRDGQKTGTPGHGFGAPGGWGGGARRDAHWGLGPGQAPPPTPIDAPSAGPVWTVPAIVCGGRLLGRIVLAVSNLPGPSRATVGDPAPASAPHGRVGQPRDPPRGAIQLLRGAPTQPPAPSGRPGSRPGGGDPHPQAISAIAQSECDGNTVCTHRGLARHLLAG